MGFSIILKKMYTDDRIGHEKILGYLVALLSLAITFTVFTAVARADDIVYLVPIKGTINSRVPQFIARAIDDAEHAKAKVDEEVEIPELIEKGKLLTLTTNEVLKYRVADHEVENIDELLKAFDLVGVQIVSIPASASEQFLRPWILWLILAAVCLVAEIFTAGFFILWFGVAGAIAAALAAVGLSMAWQWGTFVIVSTVCLVLSRRFAERITKGQKKKVGPDRLIGKTGVVLEAINPDADKGKVRVESERWRAVSADGEVIDAGTHVYVIKIEGTHLIVKRRKK